MNKAITDGLVLMPPPFSAGLNQWSREDGTPGSATYAGQPNAAYVPSDQDFGGCLELSKVDTTQKLRYMGQTPIEPGLYLRVTARVKVVAGNLPSVRIAAWAGRANGTNVSVPGTGPAVAL
ncbi:MAG TPA: right-handed parallel beta-helix repeat-containing protein, partial [Paracoccaceae bacterium]